MSNKYNSILSIAGSDSGGCAGIQADIKSISANGGYAATVITATTAQNTCGVTDIHAIPIAHIEAQLEAVLSDIEFNAIKIGMLHSVAVINTVKEAVKKFKINKIVLDPVMIATSGDKLITDDAIIALKSFLPEVYLITPNIPEAELLIGHAISRENMAESAKEIAEKFSVSVLLKAGHLKEETAFLTDTLYIKEFKRSVTITNKKINTLNTHGTGCSLSSCIATYLGEGFSLEESVQRGCNYINAAISSGKNKTLGKGNGPVDHFYAKIS